MVAYALTVLAASGPAEEPVSCLNGCTLMVALAEARSRPATGDKGAGP